MSGMWVLYLCNLITLSVTLVQFTMTWGARRTTKMCFAGITFCNKIAWRTYLLVNMKAELRRSFSNMAIKKNHQKSLVSSIMSFHQTFCLFLTTLSLARVSLKRLLSTNQNSCFSLIRIPVKRIKWKIWTEIWSIGNDYMLLLAAQNHQMIILDFVV